MLRQGESKLDGKPPISWWARTSSILDVCYMGLESEGNPVYNGPFLNYWRMGGDTVFTNIKGLPQHSQPPMK